MPPYSGYGIICCGYWKSCGIKKAFRQVLNLHFVHILDVGVCGNCARGKVLPLFSDLGRSLNSLKKNKVYA